jgi:hypothetical protein
MFLFTIFIFIAINPSLFLHVMVLHLPAQRMVLEGPPVSSYYENIPPAFAKINRVSPNYCHVSKYNAIIH